MLECICTYYTISLFYQVSESRCGSREVETQLLNSVSGIRFWKSTAEVSVTKLRKICRPQICKPAFENCDDALVL